MNIFKILSSYDGNINEPNISALLAYLLDPNEDHGLGYKFVNDITKSLPNDEKIKHYLNNSYDYKVMIRPELSVDVQSPDKKKRDIDIVIEFIRNDNAVPEFSIAIENKIRTGSVADKKQFIEEMEGLKQGYDPNIDVYFILICPPSKKIKDIFFKVNTDKKARILWKNSQDEQKSVIDILQNILLNEQKGEIDPLSTEILYILKSFVVFIDNDFQSEEKTEKYERGHYGKPVVDYLGDIREKRPDDKKFTKVEILEELSELVKSKSGKTLHKGTAKYQLEKTIVNEKNRIHWGIKKPYDERMNLFYYPDESDTKMIMKLPPQTNGDNITVYWKGNEGEEKSAQWSEIIAAKDDK